MKKNKLTYEKSGVNIKAADKFVKFISSISNKTKKSGKFKNIGNFGSITQIPKTFKNPQIVSTTDGVGTKIEIANLLKKFDTIGIDLVAMCINDLIVQGAKPIIFLDYVSINKLDLKKLKIIMKGIVKGCKISKCELVGGETAEMPNTYKKNKFDIAGFSVGIVEKKKILNNKIKKNNLVLAVPSSGLHSNGYSLVRHIIKYKKIDLNKNIFLKKELIKPTKIYSNEVLKLSSKNLITGCANITGGGILDNLKRVLPKNMSAEINLNKIKSKKIFKWIKKQGVGDKEMLKTFNCGVGFCLIAKNSKIQKIQKHFTSKFKPYVIGKIISGKNEIIFNEKINWGK
tara:strand:- start:232 stop:1260 length:1029 start_codon:yes stop_codon:yes gene_type:complete